MPASFASSSDHDTKGLGFNGVKVFSATMMADREGLSDKVTNWLAARPEMKLVDITVTQSSDASFHCLALTVFYYEAPRPR